MWSGERAASRTWRRSAPTSPSSPKTSADAKAAWTADPTLDAWLIWNIWQVANPKLAETVPVEPELRIWRDTAVALTVRGETNPQTRRFVCFLQSPGRRHDLQALGVGLRRPRRLRPARALTLESLAPEDDRSTR